MIHIIPIFTCALCAAVGALATYIHWRGKYNDLKYKKLTPKEEIIISLNTELFSKKGEWEIVDLCSDIAVAEKCTYKGETFTKCVKFYPYNDEDSKAYAIRCAEELIDKLNEEI